MLQTKNEKIKSHIFYFVCVVLAGSILANIFLRCDRDVSAFTVAYIDSVSLEQMTVGKTLVYIFLRRAKQAVLLYLLYKVFPPRYVFAAVLSVLLLLFGFCLSCQMYYLGTGGVCYLLLCLLPHYLFYLFLLYFLSMRIRQSATTDKQRILTLGVSGIIFLTAVMSESVLSKIFLKNFLQYMGM